MRSKLESNWKPERTVEREQQAQKFALYGQFADESLNN